MPERLHSSCWHTCPSPHCRPPPLQDEVKERDARIKDAQTMAIRAESQLSGLKTVLATKTSQCHRMESEVSGAGGAAGTGMTTSGTAHQLCLQLQ